MSASARAELGEGGGVGGGGDEGGGGESRERKQEGLNHSRETVAAVGRLIANPIVESLSDSWRIYLDASYERTSSYFTYECPGPASASEARHYIFMRRKPEQ